MTREREEKGVKQGSRSTSGNPPDKQKKRQTTE